MKTILKLTLWAFGIFILLGVGAGGALWYIWSSNLPYIGSLEEYNPPIITEVYSSDGEVIGRFWEEKRIVIPLDKAPDHLINAFIAAEDARFFQHEGVDVPSIFRAFIKNLKAGKIEQGGSTITQQVTKSMLLKNTEKTYKRKFREAMLSLQIEKKFTKEQILFLYLNQIYLGHGAHGVEAAARTYFNKIASEMNLAECALLAGLPQAPSRYSLIQYFDRAKARQKYVLERMREEGYITEAQEKEAFGAEVIVGNLDETPFHRAPFFTEHVRRYLEKKYGRDLLYRGGLQVHTTLNLHMQQAAQESLRKGLKEFDKREGYRGPSRSLLPEEILVFKRETAEYYRANPLKLGDTVKGVVEEVDDHQKQLIIGIGQALASLPLSEMKWARRPDPETAYYAAELKRPSKIFEPGDILSVRIKEKGEAPFDWLLSLEQAPVAEGAIFCIEAESGRVKAMVGGKDFRSSQFNRAIQAKRQPGSSFKPFIYAAALDWGMNPATVIIDAPYISSMKPDEDLWRPKNYNKKFLGPTLFRTALIKSKNVITVKILKKIGIEQAIQYARNMGIETKLSPDLSLALGSSGISLAELTKAYTVFANGGMMLADTIFIDRIEDRSGRIIEENQPVFQESISKETAFVITDLLKAAIQEGTGWRIKALKRPAAGKTGTTNDLRDAWFMGYTPGLVTGVWVGYDNRRPMGRSETGSRAASPIWLYFMQEVLKDRPVEDFSVPEGVVFAKIDAKNGLLASPHSEKTVFQAFKEEEEPKEYAPTPEEAKSGHFVQFDMDFSQ